MALPPKFAGQEISSRPDSSHTIELYLDYVCPFSGKMWKTLSENIFPTLKQRYPNKNLRFILRQQIQPWHPSSTLVHEAAIAVLRLAPEKYVAYSSKLFEHQREFFDVSVLPETRHQTYARLARLAAAVGVPEDDVLQLLRVADRPDGEGGLNVGNAVTDDVKFMVKANRLTGVHVTPTVLFNGVVENGISSSFTAEQWEEWLQKNIV